MTPRFKLALTGLLAMCLATGLTWLLLGGPNKGDPIDELDGEDQRITGERNPELLSGTEAERAAARAARVGGTVPINAREPFGADYSDPVFRARKLAELLEAPVIKWNEVRRLLSIEDGRLSDTTKMRLVDAIRQPGTRGLVLQAISVVRDNTFAESLLEFIDEDSISAAERQIGLLALAAMPVSNADEVATQLASRLSGNFAKDAYVLTAIASRGGGQAARTLVEYMQRNDNGTVRASAFDEFDFSKDPDAREIFEAALRKEKSEGVTKQLLTMVGKPGSGELVDAVRAIEGGEATMAVRKAALQALSKIGTADAIEHVLLRARESGVMGEAALRALDSVTSADLEAREALRKELDRAGLSSRPTQAKSKLLRALGRLKDKDSLPAMVEALDDNDDAVGRAAIVAIGQLGDHGKPAFPRLVSHYKGADTSTRRSVVHAMVGIGGSDALKNLEKWVQEEGLETSLQHQLRIAIQSVRSKIDQSRSQ